MVSFSCDNCQDVVTKPKVLTHFRSCGTRTVSCIDCGSTFTCQSVKPHTSCVSEEVKYGPREAGLKKENGENFCVDCNLPLNGAVARCQHYESRKHKANVRRKQASQNKEDKNASSKATHGSDDTSNKTAIEATANVSLPCGESYCDVAASNVIAPAPRTPTTKAEKIPCLRKAMKQILNKSQKPKMKLSKLERALKEYFGDKVPNDLFKRIRRRAERPPFSISKSKASVSLSR